MALSNIAIYPDGTEAPTASFPDGKPKNATSDAGTDGFPFEQLRLSDYEAFFQGILARQGQTANGISDNAIVGQNLDALMQSTGFVLNIVNDMNNNKFIRDNQLIKTRGQNVYTDGISRHYLIRFSIYVSTPKPDDVVLTGDSLGFTAVFVGEVSNKPRAYELTYPSAEWVAVPSNPAKVVRVGGVLHFTGAIEFIGTGTPPTFIANVPANFVTDSDGSDTVQMTRRRGALSSYEFADVYGSMFGTALVSNIQFGEDFIAGDLILLNGLTFIQDADRS